MFDTLERKQQVSEFSKVKEFRCARPRTFCAELSLSACWVDCGIWNLEAKAALHVDFQRNDSDASQFPLARETTNQRTSTHRVHLYPTGCLCSFYVFLFAELTRVIFCQLTLDPSRMEKTWLLQDSENVNEKSDKSKLSTERNDEEKELPAVTKEAVSGEKKDGQWFREVLGFLICACGCVFAASSAVFVKMLDGAVPDIEVSFGDGSGWVQDTVCSSARGY